MKKLQKLLIIFSLSVVSAQLLAIEIADIDIAPQASIAGLDKPLLLNGAGIRYKFFFKVYVGALYLTQKQRNPKTVLESNGPNRILMHFIYDEVSQEKLTDAWREGFENNTEKAQMAALKDRLAKFNTFFTTVHAGDVVLLDYVPGKGTTVHVKGVEKGVIKGGDFNRALLAVWLGEAPVTEDLKEAMLGGE
ncbi:MAG TPA: hypothetical protein ENJ08_09420 [Gammaproteobacteria bacterium]|nr:hypothetical protein [Gammaproteobacteria bacterium]